MVPTSRHYIPNDAPDELIAGTERVLAKARSAVRENRWLRRIVFNEWNEFRYTPEQHRVHSRSPGCRLPAISRRTHNNDKNNSYRSPDPILLSQSIP